MIQRIRRVYDTARPSDRDRIDQVQEIFRASFADVKVYAEKIPDLLAKPFKYGYRTVLLVAENGVGRVRGFSLILHFPEVNSSLLDFMAVAPGVKGGGVGGSLYEATREYCRSIGSRGLYMEVLPDDPQKVTDPAVLETNRRRLRFYEHYGVRPIVNTAYETPIGESAGPHLLFDPLGREDPLGRDEARVTVRLLLGRKYARICSKQYVEMVVESFRDDPVQFRPPRYVKSAPKAAPVATGKLPRSFALAYSTAHSCPR